MTPSDRADSDWISLDEKMPEPGESVILEAIDRADGCVGRCIAFLSHDPQNHWFTEMWGYEVIPAPQARWHPLPPREEGE